MWPVLVLVLVCVVLVAPLCVRCPRRPMRSISETHTSEDTYIPSTQFRIHRPGQTYADQNYVQPPSNHLSPHVSLDRPKSHTHTDSESNDYENTGSDCDSDREKGTEDPGYIQVLPADDESRPSTPSPDHNYVNLESESDYLNVLTEPPESNSSYENLEEDSLPDASRALTIVKSFITAGSDSDSDSDDDDDDEGDYVNQPSKLE